MRTVGLLALVCAAGIAGPSLAGEITLTLIGEKFGASPSFAVSIGDTEIGSGELSSALDTEKGEWIRTIADLAPFTGTYSFTFDDSLLTGDAAIGVSLRNDAWDGEGGFDTNLFVAAIRVDGVALSLDRVEFTGEGGAAAPIAADDGRVAIISNGTARFAAPEGGWAAVATAGPAAEPEEAADNCAATGTVAVTAFGNDASELSTDAQAAINAFVDGKDLAGCTLDIVGYASLSGSAEGNVRVSRVRAQAIADFIAGKGLEIKDIKVTGFGGTDQFGAAQAENRRVVVTIQ